MWQSRTSSPVEGVASDGHPYSDLPHKPPGGPMAQDPIVTPIVSFDT